MTMLPPGIKVSTMDRMPVTFCQPRDPPYAPIWDSKRYSLDVESQMTPNDPSGLLDPRMLRKNAVYIIKWRNKLP